MKFLVMIYSDNTLLEAMPQEQFNETMRGCLAKADELRSKGRLLDSQMLEGASTAKTIRIRNGRRTIMDGPFTETKELLAGFNLIEADDMEEALRIAQEFPWAETGSIEVRPILEISTMRARVNAPAVAASH
jgi:hypothetical protein